MSTLARGLTVFAIVLALGACLVAWDVYSGNGHKGFDTTITKSEMEALVRDMDPRQRKTMAESKEQRDKLLNSLRELLAVASEATKHGYADRPGIKNEFKFFDTALLAVNYDRKVNADKGPMPPLGMISEDRVKEFWGEMEPDENLGWLSRQAKKVSWIWEQVNARWHKGEFDNFIKAKIALARENGQLPPDQEPTEEQLAMARNDYARTQISYYDAKAKLASIPSLPEGPQKKEWEHFQTVVELQTRLQKAQLLSATYMKEVIAKAAAVTEEEVKAYIAKHPELTKNAEKLNTAKEILKKAKAGADMAELAKEYSDDPGSKSRGGLYEGVVKGQFAGEFEEAVNKIKPGEIAPDIVETPYGYHIIKLEKRGEAKGASGEVQPTYDARHVLISTMIKDPENPNASAMPVEQFVKNKLAIEKQAEIMANIKADNPVSVPDNFVIPQATQEELKVIEAEQEKRMDQMRNQGRPGPQQPAGPATKR